MKRLKGAALGQRKCEGVPLRVAELRVHAPSEFFPLQFWLR